MTKIKVFFLEPTDRERQWLRRYRSVSGAPPCAKREHGNCCEAMFDLGEADILYTKEGYIDARDSRRPPTNDPRWPTQCQHCGGAFTEKDEFQLFGRQIYIRESDGFRCTLEDAPPGACWDAWWISDRRSETQIGCAWSVGPDRRSLVVKCPGGHDWYIDSRASNCTLPNDNEHWCWIRTGRPEDGNLHVDKNGKTCAAGAGSIQTKNWHGFLHNGYLSEQP